MDSLCLDAANFTTCAPPAATAGAMRNSKFAKHFFFSSRAMREPIKRQPIIRRPGHLAGAFIAMGLSVGLTVAPAAAPRRLVAVPRPRPAALGAQSPPVAAAQNRDQKQPSQTNDAARGEMTAGLRHVEPFSTISFL